MPAVNFAPTAIRDLERLRENKLYEFCPYDPSHT